MVIVYLLTGFLSMHVKTSILATPSLTTPSSMIKGVLADPLTLSCTSEGSPPDKFTWMKDGIPIKNNINTVSVTHTRTIVVFQSNYSISHFSASDSGTYTCNITNPIGSTHKSIVVSSLYSK